VLAAILPPAAAFAAQSYFWLITTRWSLFYPAIFISSWIGGFWSGLGATALSIGLIWWYYIPPLHGLIKYDARYYFTAVVFTALGFVVSAMHRRLRRLTMHLAESQRFLQAILDHSPNGIVIKSPDGRYLVTNRGLESLTGVSAAQSLGKTDFDLFPASVAERFRSNDKIVRETVAPLITEERVQPTHGRTFLVSKFPLVDEKNRLFAICAIWSDISGRKHDEEALQRSMRDLRMAQRVAHVGSWSWDLRSNEAEWSDELFHIFGLNPSSGVPRILSDDAHLFSPESGARMRAAVDKLRVDGQPYELDLEIVRSDGSSGWITARGEAVTDEAGDVVAITGTAEDITRLKELQRLREEWMSVIAHDLRQPIGIIAMAADFLPSLHESQLSTKEEDMMSRIRSSAHTLARMVEDLLDLSLLEAQRLKLERIWVDPSALVYETIDRLSHLTGDRRVKVIDGHMSRVFVDPMRIGQVLGNLVSNAVKYGERDKEIVVRLEPRAGEVEVAVTNYGKGIEAAELPRIFNRFARTKMSRGSSIPGLGLGLYISKGVIEAHGGRMWVESTPGATTTFHVTLPAAAVVHEAA
jgi:PAS domain S-box-containing protein